MGRFVDLFDFTFLFLVVSNTLLVRRLTASVRNASLKLSAGSQSDQAENRQKKVSSVTLTLVLVSTVFILLCLPLSVCIILYQFIIKSTQNDGVESKALIKSIYYFFSVLWFSNSAVNFYLYCLTGSKFRAECLRILTCSILSRGNEKSASNGRPAQIDISSTIKHYGTDTNNDV